MLLQYSYCYPHKKQKQAGTTNNSIVITINVGNHIQLHSSHGSITRSYANASAPYSEIQNQHVDSDPDLDPYSLMLMFTDTLQP